MIVNATIESTMLGREEHGIFTFFLYVNLGKDIGHCGIGGYALDMYDSKVKRRKIQSKSIEFISKILDVVGVETWEDLPGKYIRVNIEGGWGMRIYEFGNIIEEKWISFEDFFKNNNEEVTSDEN